MPKSSRDIWRGTKSTNFRARAGGAWVRITLSVDRTTDRCHCSSLELSSHPTGLMQVGIKYVSSINLANTVHLTLVITQDRVPPNLLTQPESLLVAPSIQRTCLGPCCGLSKISQRSKKPKQAVDSFSMPCSSC